MTILLSCFIYFPLSCSSSPPLPLTPNSQPIILWGCPSARYLLIYVSFAPPFASGISTHSMQMIPHLWGARFHWGHKRVSGRPSGNLFVLGCAQPNSLVQRSLTDSRTIRTNWRVYARLATSQNDSATARFLYFWRQNERGCRLTFFLIYINSKGVFIEGGREDLRFFFILVKARI